MVASIIRESAFGQTLRLLSGKRLFKYPEEVDPDYWQQKYGSQNNPDPSQSRRRSSRPQSSSSSSSDLGRDDVEKDEQDEFDDSAPAPYVPRGPSSAWPEEMRHPAPRHGSDSTQNTKVGSRDEKEKGGEKSKENKKNNGDAEKGRDYQLVEWEENDPEV